MWYMIHGVDAPDSLDKRKAARPDHLARLQGLQDAGRLLIAGPLPAEDDTTQPGPAGFVGSLVVAEFDSIEAARLWAADDPYMHAGVYREVHVHPWLQVFPVLTVPISLFQSRIALMRMIKNPLVIAIAATMFLAGCGEDKKTDAPQSTGDKSAVATVNGAVITRQDLDAVKAQMPARGGSDADVVDQLVELKLLAQKAEKDGLAKDPAIMAELDRAHESILANHLVKKFLKDKTFTDEDMKAEYEQVITKMPKKDELKAAHILVEDEALAKKLTAKLNEGADFAALAKENSTDPGSKDQGGDLGWFEPGMMVPEFAAAVSALEPGKLTTEPVKTQFGWHIIKLEEKRQVPPPAFDSVKPQLTNMMRQKAVEKFVEEARQQAKIDITLPKAEEPAAATDKPAEGNGK